MHPIFSFSVGPVSDSRFSSVRNTDTPCDVSYLSTRYKSATDWNKRAAELKQQILASAGLLPMPEKTPLNARIFGRIDRGDYTIERVSFESLPGFFVTGNLYRPTVAGLHPAVLCPNGHWGNGRLENTKDCSVPGRCINFARQGYVAFSYEMIGWGLEPRQISHDLGSLREKLWGISSGGLQLLNSIRALDFLQSLSDVDKDRIACTGASGGGTQTFLLAAVDDRVKVTAPVNMISAIMQGGCACENLPGLRLDTDNVEIGALTAPRPMLLVSATGDWTRNVPTLEYPAIREIYRLYDAERHVSCVQIQAGHNYNKDSREAVYSWFAKWLPEKANQQVKEQPFEVEKTEDLLAFPDGKLPTNAVDSDGLIQHIIASSEAQLNAHKPKDKHTLTCFAETYRPALKHALGLNLYINVEAEEKGKSTCGEYAVTKLVLHERNRDTAIPALLFTPESETDGTVLVVSGSGKQSLLNRTGYAPGELLDALLRHKKSVLLIDTFGTGEHTAPAGAPVRDPSSGYFDTYNRTDCSERVFDILTALTYLTQGQHRSVELIGIGEAGLDCLLARPFAPKLNAVVADAAGFDASKDESYLNDFYAPCLRRAGDFRTALALDASGRLYIHNTQGKFDISWAETAYTVAGHTDDLQIESSLAADTGIVRWLTKE